MAGKESMVEFVDAKCPSLEGYTLIEGFPGMGLVGTIGAKYLTEKLEFKEAGWLNSMVFVPIIRIHYGLPVHPSRIYVSDKYKIVLLVSEQIVPQVFTDKMSKGITDWIQKKKISRVISLSGIRALPKKDGRKTIYGITFTNLIGDCVKLPGIVRIGGSCSLSQMVSPMTV